MPPSVAGHTEAVADGHISRPNCSHWSTYWATGGGRTLWCDRARDRRESPIPVPLGDRGRAANHARISDNPDQGATTAMLQNRTDITEGSHFGAHRVQISQPVLTCEAVA
jgi:hypothetical protein